MIIKNDTGCFVPIINIQNANVKIAKYYFYKSYSDLLEKELSVYKTIDSLNCINESKYDSALSIYATNEMLYVQIIDEKNNQIKKEKRKKYIVKIVCGVIIVLLIL